MIFGVDLLSAKAFWAAVLMGLFCPVIGRHMVMGRSIMLGLALPQVALCGIAFVFLGAGVGWHWTTFFADDSTKAFAGALVFTLPVLLLLAMPVRRRIHLSEGWLAYAYLASVAAANLMLSSNAVGEMYIDDLFHGRLLLISDWAITFLGSGLSVCFALAMAFRRRVLLTLTDPDFAAVSGLRLRRWNMVLALMNGCVVGIAVATVGPLVTFGFLILPVLAVAGHSKSLRTHLVWSMGFGVCMAAVGYFLSYRFDFPLGACVVAVGCLGLLVAHTLRVVW